MLESWHLRAVKKGSTSLPESLAVDQEKTRPVSDFHQLGSVF